MTDSAGRGRRGAPVGLVHSALAVGGFAIGTTEFATMSLLPFFAKDLGISAPTAGHVISAYALGVVIGAPLIAVLSARMARRTLLIVLMSVFAVANGLSALAPTYHWMLLFRFLSGLPHGAYFGIAALVAASLVPVERRTQAVGRVLLGLTIATIVGVPFANWVGQAFGWRWGFAVVAFLALLTVALVAMFAPRDRVDPGASPLRELGALRRATGLADPRDGGYRLWRPFRGVHLSRLHPHGGDRRVCRGIAGGVGLLWDRHDGWQPDRAQVRGSGAHADGRFAAGLVGGCARALPVRRREALEHPPGRHRSRVWRRAGDGYADASDGRSGRRSGAGSCAQSFGVQCR